MSADAKETKAERGFRLSYKFRLYPTAAQEQYFAVNFKCVRFVYNYFLDARMKAYQAYKADPEHCKPMSHFDATKALTTLKKESLDRSGRPWLKAADSTALVYALRNLDSAYQNFFRRVKEGGGKAGFPKFKSRNDSRQSFTVGNLKLEDNAVVLPKIGAVKARIHRDVKGTVVSGTVSKNAAGQYYISINVKDAAMDPLPPTNSAVGVAMGLDRWVVTSSGEEFGKPGASEKLERKLAREQRRLARRQKGSANYQKQKLKLARIHKKVADKREYETHGLTRRIVDENSIIVSQDMASRALMSEGAAALPKGERRRLNKAVMDANFAEVNRQLEYKAEWAGRSFTVLPADAPVSQTCSECGCPRLEKAAPTWECFECGARHDERLNAARNVLNAGLKAISEKPQGLVDPEREDEE